MVSTVTQLFFHFACKSSLKSLKSIHVYTLYALTFCDGAPTDWSPQLKPVAGRTGLGMSFSVATKQEDVIMPVRANVQHLVVEEEEMEEEWEYLDESQVYLRSKFYESWLWMDVSLPGEAGRDG